MADAGTRAAKALREHERRTAPLERLDAARRLREAADALEQESVQAARDSGCTWTEIARVYGLTKQAAQQRFRAKPQKSPDAS